MSKRYDVIVVGVGSMGSAACYHLARRGIKVLGLEQFALAHELGAHHGQSRVIRLAFYPFAEYIPLLRRAYSLWEELEAETNGGLFQITGGAFMGPPESELIRRASDVSRKEELAYEIWDQAQLHQRFPQFHLPTGFQVFYDPQAGYLRPELAVAAQAKLAANLGAEIHSQEPVVEWHTDAEAVVVQTTRQKYEADHLILAGGAWSQQLLAELNLPLTVTRQVLAWYRPDDPQSFALGRFPIWFVEIQPGCGHYGFPLIEGNDGIKIALDMPGQVTNPEAIDRQVSQDDVENLHEFLSNYIPAAAGELVSATVCLYTNSPDNHFFIDSHPEQNRVTVACGFSGHGFKFASAVGEGLAELAVDRTTKIPLEFFGFGRLNA